MKGRFEKVAFPVIASDHEKVAGDCERRSVQNAQVSSWSEPHLTKSGKRSKYDPTARWLYTKGSLDRELRSRDWSSIEHSYLQPPPRLLPFEWLRAKLIVVATK